MNQLEIQTARRARLSYQTQILREVDRDGRQVLGEDGYPVIDLDRVPYVLSAVGVPPTLVGATFATSKFPRAQVEAVRDWLHGIVDGNETEYSALLIGKGGNYTAAAVLRNAVKMGRTVAWYDWHTFTRRYTSRIDRAQLLRHAGSSEEADDVAYEMNESEAEDFHLRQIYDVLVIVDFDIDDVLDFAVPDICAMIRYRNSFGLATVISVPAANSDPLSDQNTKRYGGRGALLRLFEDETRVFDGR